MSVNLFENKNAWKLLDTKSLMNVIPNYFDSTGNVEKSAYLNWRFDFMRDTENQFYEMGKAYFETAIALIDICLSNNKDKKADIWIFPILFNIVHGTEIYLKGFNSQIRILDKIEKQEYQESKIEGKHNISQLCQTAISLIKKSSHKDLLSEFKFVKKFIDVLYEKLVEGDSTPEAFANRLYEFIDEFNERFNSEISSDDILQLCVNKS